MEKLTQIFTIIKCEKEGSYFICLSLILINSVFKKVKKNYDHQIFLENCKYVVKEIMIHNYIIDVIEIPSDEKGSDEEILEKFQIKKISDKEDSDEEDSSKEDSSEKNQFFFSINK